MKSPFRIILLLLIPLCSFSSENRVEQGKYVREKSFHRSYPVSQSALLKMNTEYSNITINTWDKNEVVFDIIIRVNGDEEEKVIASLRESKIEIDAEQNKIEVRSFLNKLYSERTERGDSWSFSLGDWLTISGNGGKKRVREMVNIEVDFQIKMPVNNHLNISNTYGDLHLTRLRGDCRLNCSYGVVSIGELLGDSDINVDYAPKVNIDVLNKAKITADYCSGLHIEKANDLTLNCDYSHTFVKEVNQLKYYCDYGSLEIETVNDVSGNGDYIRTEIGNVQHNAYISTDYGSFKITHLKKGFNSIDIKADYASVKVFSENDNAFRFKVNTLLQ